MQWAHDYWFAEDKWNHLTGSFFSTWGFYLSNIFVVRVFSPMAALIFACIFTFLAGLIIEVIQTVLNQDDPSWRDIVANVTGIALAVLTILWG